MRKDIILLLIIVAVGFAVNESPKEKCTADYCIAEGETIEQVLGASGYYYYIIKVDGIKKHVSPLFEYKGAQQYFADQEVKNFKPGYEVEYYYTENKEYL